MEHAVRAMLYAGLPIHGYNAETGPSQWEY